MTIPRLTVIIPTFNDGSYIVEAVTSVLNQTWKAAEIIVVDDGSNDDTAILLAPFEDRINYLYQSNQGRAAARNHGIVNSNGEYIAFLDADDIWYPSKIEDQLQSMQKQSSALWSYHQTRLVDEGGQPLESGFWPEFFGSGAVGVADLAENFLVSGLEISTSTIMVKRELLTIAGSFDEALATGEDTEMWARLAHASPVAYFPAVLATRRIDTESTFLERWQNYESSKFGLMAAISALEKLPLNEQKKAQILGETYRQSALINYNTGNLQTAKTHWDLSLDLLGSDYFYKSGPRNMAHFAISAARYHANGPILAEQILRDTVKKAELSSELGDQSIAELYAVISHLYQLKHEKGKARNYARKALKNNYRLWSNIGLWKKSISFIG